MRSREAADKRAAEAADLFCYQARKWIGAFAAALGGIETLVFQPGSVKTPLTFELESARNSVFSASE